MLKRIPGVLALALLPLTAGAATIIVPAAGTGPGAGGSRWSSELIVHNAASVPVDITMTYHDASGASAPKSATIAARATVTTADIVKNVFGLDSGTGAITIDVDDTRAGQLAVTSRTFNTSANGIFGQDVPAVNADDASAAGDLTVLEGPASATDFRFNFGLYAINDASVRWELLRADGTLAATKDVDYTGGTQFQYNGGVSTLLGVTPADGDVVYANVTKGKVVTYGSAINNASGDPTFVPGVHTRADTHVAFGVDLNGDGVVDISDANNDGVLDQPVNLYTIGFPNYFHVIVPGKTDAKVELVDQSIKDILLLDDKGEIEWAPSSTLRGTT
ncbi:MAG TPA: hypothetical protein VG323_21845, partial [Thermoanaerobaculia bacterium]|nr:hypothetical protein [Thermoanaerobaculia bacterium]